MTDILRTIRKTDEARRAVKAARTQLGRIETTPRRATLMHELEVAAVELERTLEALRSLKEAQA